MDRNALTLRLEREAKGALRELAFKTPRAWRRYGAEQDEDGWMFPFASPFSIDAKKIWLSKAIRRSDRKTQVLTLQSNKHARVRLSHTFEVAGAVLDIAEILWLNKELCLAGAWGHDIGHAPFGHDGEKFISKVTGKTFKHEIFGVVLSQKIERKGKGLNLTRQTLGCIRKHSRGAGELHTNDMTPEEAAVMYADKIAYIFADYNDIFGRMTGEAHSLRLEEFTGLKEAADWFGANQRERVFTAVAHLCLESAGAGKVSFEKCEAAERFAALKKKMYEVYARIDRRLHERAMETVYEQLPKIVPEVDPAILFALMSDEDIWRLARRLRKHKRLEAGDLARLSVAEILPYLKDKEIDFTDPDLNW